MGRRALNAAKQIEIQSTDRLLEGMNPEQSEAIQHTEGPICVLAGAGSGKTRVLIHRVAYLVRYGGISASRILAVTFSKNAAEEMRERGKKLGLDAEFRTWHSLALHILKEDHTHWASWEIDSKDRAKYLLKDVLGWKGMNWTSADLGKVQSFIGFCKSQLWGCESKEARDYSAKLGLGPRGVEAYQRYEVAITENRLLTFDDILVFAVQHLESDPSVGRVWAGRWDYVLQDEAQDANPVQLRIATILASHRNLMIVGDPAQSIFKFRGSEPKFILEFGQQWGGKVVSMHRNYRCGSSIIEAANNVIRPSQNRLPTDIISETGTVGSVVLHRPETLEDEGEEVAGSIEANVANGSSYQDNAVLYRLNAQSRGIEEALLARKIPYVVVGGCSFYERKEVKDLLAYLRLVDGRAIKDSIRRAINAPFRFLGAAYLERVASELGRSTDFLGAIDRANMGSGVQQRQRRSAQDFSGLVGSAIDRANNGSSPAEILQVILDATDYEGWLKRDQGEESLETSHVANVRELVRVAGRFSTVKELLDFVDATIDESKANAESSKGRDRVLLMSIHKSKGLEFRHVFFVGAVEMVIPHPKAEDLDEERRLAYVAITRAKESLTVSSPRFIATKAGLKEVAPSRYVVEAGIE